VNRTASILIGLALFLAFVTVLTWQMLGNRKHKVEVCMTYQGASNCAVATATSKDEAVRTATSTACTLIAGGVTDTMACERTAPASIKELD
jgi:type II secretory pathway component PulM